MNQVDYVERDRRMGARESKTYTGWEFNNPGTTTPPAPETAPEAPRAFTDVEITLASMLNPDELVLEGLKGAVEVRREIVLKDPPEHGWEYREPGYDGVRWDSDTTVNGW